MAVIEFILLMAILLSLLGLAVEIRALKREVKKLKDKNL